jgi:LuxR family maltose regulon positive regulatory protein
VDRVRRTAEATGGRGWNVAALALEAALRQALGETRRALTALSQALALAEPEGYVRTFVDEGRPMAELLRRAVDEGIAPGYADRLLEAFEPVSVERAPGTAAFQLLPEPLSEREQQVLDLLAAGLTYKAVAAELVVSVNTVRYHVKNLYGKLEAGSRAQALARARELGLLSSGAR